jgi:PIN domain nuclease of toxin-antitoxin system
VIVLDASALLALLHGRPAGRSWAQGVAADSATISAVNYAEVVQKAAQHPSLPRMWTKPP